LNEFRRLLFPGNNLRASNPVCSGNSAVYPTKPAVCRNRLAHCFTFAYSDHTQTHHWKEIK